MQLIPLLINFTSFAQLQIKDKLRTFPRREGFTRNKEKISNLICFGPFVILSKPSLPGQGQDRPTVHWSTYFGHKISKIRCQKNK